MTVPNCLVTVPNCLIVSLDKRLSPEGTKGSILELAAEVVKQLQIIERNRSRRADARIAELDEQMKIVDGDDPDRGDVRWAWDKLDAMNKSKRGAAIQNAFAVDDKITIFAVLNWSSLLDEFDPKWIEELKRLYGKARNPLIADEFATLTDDRARLKFTIESAISEISSDSGLGKNTLRERLNDANDLILESELRRTESSEDQQSGKNVRSPHAPNTPVTV